MPRTARPHRLRVARDWRRRDRAHRGLRRRGRGRRHRRPHRHPQGRRPGRQRAAAREDDQGPRLLRVLRRRRRQVPGGHRDRQDRPLRRDPALRLLALPPRAGAHLLRPLRRGHRLLAGHARQGPERLRDHQGRAGPLHLRHARPHLPHRHRAGLLLLPRASRGRRRALGPVGHLRVPRDAAGGQERLQQRRHALLHARRAARAGRVGPRDGRHRQGRRRLLPGLRRKGRHPGHRRLRLQPRDDAGLDAPRGLRQLLLVEPGLGHHRRRPYDGPCGGRPDGPHPPAGHELPLGQPRLLLRRAHLERHLLRHPGERPRRALRA